MVEAKISLKSLPAEKIINAKKNICTQGNTGENTAQL